MEIQEWQHVEDFDVSNNKLAGPLMFPNNFSSLDVFNVSGNPGLTGTIPEEICSLPEVELGYDCSEKMCGCDCLCRMELMLLTNGTGLGASSNSSSSTGV